MSAPYRASPQPLFIQNKMLDTTGINSYITGIFMFQVMQSEEPNMFSTFYRCNNTIHEHETRTASDIHVIFAKTRARKFSIRVTGANLWNTLPDSIRKSPSIHVFKKRLKIHLLDLQSNLITCNTWLMRYWVDCDSWEGWASTFKFGWASWVTVLINIS